MVKQMTRLLFTKKPYSDESFAGYLIRLCELNFVERLSWILKAAGLKNKYSSTTYPGISSKEDLALLAGLTGTDAQILKNLAYKINPDFPNTRKPRYILYDFSFPTHFIVTEHSRICSLCLTETNYLRRIWEFAPITFCLVHKCRLLDVCPGCQGAIKTDRGSVSLCFCGYDWRSADVFYVSDDDMRIAVNIARLSELKTEINVCQEINQLPETLKKLGLLSFLKLLIFFASALAGLPDSTERKFFRAIFNTDLHEYLNSALVIFDNYPQNFFIFLDWIKYQNFSRHVNKSSFGGRQKIIDRKRESIENFEVILRNELIAPEYEFVLDGFDNYLKRYSGGYVSNLLFSHNPIVLALFYRRLIKSRQSISDIRDERLDLPVVYHH